MQRIGRAVDQPLLRGLAGDGRPLVAAGALGLLASGIVAAFLGVTYAFLPHDLAWVGMDGAQLTSLADRRVADFMVHDRVAFGGALAATAILHLWLLRFGPAEGPWAWWTLTVSAAAGFVSFLGFLAYGYLDTWHLLASLALLPLYAVGLALARSRFAVRNGPPDAAAHGLPAERPGRLVLILAAIGLVGGGLSVLWVGMTGVFVAEDLVFIGHPASDLAGVSPRLIPLIAHDRASFGGAVLATGVATFGIAAFGRRSRHRTEALALAGLAGFGGAIGIHVAVGYLDVVHVAPAVGGALLQAIGVVLDRPVRGLSRPAEAPATVPAGEA
jgi:hypothetical protein